MSGHGETLISFALRWNLDEQQFTYLESLGEEVLSSIMRDFAPREGTQDIPGKLYAFARSVASKMQSRSGVWPEASKVSLEEFAEKWKLDSAAVSWLYSLAPEVSNVLLSEFEPKEDTHNVIGKLKGFARSIQARIPVLGQSRKSSTMGSTSLGASFRSRNSLEARLMEFARKWALSEESLGFLRTLKPEVQATVMEEFDPRGDTANIHGKLRAFARSVAMIRQSQGEMEAFAARWGLDGDSFHLLTTLPEDVRRTVLYEFEPRSGTTNVDGKFKTFARSVLSRSRPEAVQGERPRSEPLGDLGNFSLSASSSRSQDPALNDFARRWGLDSESVRLVESLPEGPRNTVLKEFDPRHNTRDVGAKLRAFANTVMGGQASRSLEPKVTTEAEFLERWGLFNNKQAEDVLARLAPDVQAKVMQEFQPQQNTVNVLGKFCGFAASVERASEKASLSNSGRDLESFIHRHQLDAVSERLLRSLESHAQATVLSEFQPRDDVRDMNGKFVSFARSVAARFGSSGNARKRTAVGPPLQAPWPMRRRYG
eukprot:TRINITY_DN111388_c0_g1_i1.p1 TRINITY_DN111388_c0_g1~~TRINITY_DN111388_c0_g1_i1.p1  ORF type:complete len:541 (+),score=80.04 TRINITY_DN111388_c0_g1_i1:102-1724(+)